jgi:hypothetical protein
MVRTQARLALGVLLATLAGCTSLGPNMREPPMIIPAGATIDEDANPVYIPLPLSPFSYGRLFETLLHVLHDYDFEIAQSNRYDGRIECIPRTAPGLIEIFRPGSPDLYDRLLQTMQSYRHRVTIVVQTAAPPAGGYFVEVIVRKELEDLPRPIRASIGAATFRTQNNVDRQFQVVDPMFFDSAWIFRGRDVPLEQELIRRIKSKL